MATVEITDTNFNEIIEKNDIIIIDFWAPWCGPCKSFGPVYEKVSDEYREVVFGKVNTEEQQALAGHFQIRSIPTTVVLKENIAVFQQPGVIPEDGLRDIIKQIKELDMDVVRKEIETQEAQGDAQ